MSSKKDPIVVADMIRREDLSVPPEFENKLGEITSSGQITDESFLAACKAGLKTKKNYPEKRMGIGYRLIGISLEANERTPLMEEFISRFSTLELPDHHHIEPHLWEKLEEFVAQNSQ